MPEDEEFQQEQLTQEIIRRDITIEALKRRVMALEFEIVDHISAAIAKDMNGQAQVEL